MDKDVTLKNSDGETLYPITRAYNVLDANGEVIEVLINSKQPMLTAGDGITIDENNVISATGGSCGSYTAGDGISISNNVISLAYELATSNDIDNIFNGGAE